MPRPPLQVAAGCQQVLTSFWFQEQGDLSACSRVLWVPWKVLRSVCCLWVVVLGVKARLLFMKVSLERWPCSSGMGLRGTGDCELHGPQGPGPLMGLAEPSRAQTFRLPTAGQGGLWGEEGEPQKCA